jgi:hypothetical protein
LLRFSKTIKRFIKIIAHKAVNTLKIQPHKIKIAETQNSSKLENRIALDYIYNF